MHTNVHIIYQMLGSLTTMAISHSYTVLCDQILENSSKSHMKSGVFLHVFNDTSIHA